MTTIIINAYWLALCIYFEAGNQPLEGKIAVGHVVMNRVRERRMSVEEVIKQPYQFSFYNIELQKPIPFKDLETLEKCFKAAHDCLAERMEGYTLNGANHYFNHNLVHPSWADSMTKVAVIDDHSFYKGVSDD